MCRNLKKIIGVDFMDIAIDLGSDRTRVFIEGKGKVLDEASVITYDIDSEQI